MTGRLRTVTVALAALTVAALPLAGCGGGGGGGTANPTILYVTDWSGRASGPITGASQRVTLMREDGTVVSRQVLTAGTSPRQQARFEVPAGNYRIRAELNSEPDFRGAVSGIAEAAASPGGTIETAVGPAATTLRIEPASPLVPKGGTRRLMAAARAGDGRLAFLAPTAVTWSVSGGSATITADGTASGVAFGRSRITVTDTASGKSASTDLDTATEGARRSKWTVLVFLSAGNNLYPFAAPNVNQMEQVTNDDLRFVVQWKQAQNLYPNASFNGTRRYLVKPDTTDTVKSEIVQDLGAGIDMGKPETLANFIEWGKANYPADRYALVIWSHGNGWSKDALQKPVRATSYDDEFFSAIKVWELPTALAGHRFDILSFDACLMQMLEVASEVKPYADYIAASAENTPAAGYPYHRVFGAFASNPDAPTLDLARSFVSGHIGNPSYAKQYVTQSVLDTSKIGGVETALNQLATALIDNKAVVNPLIPGIRTDAPKYAFRNDGRYYYDLTDIARRLQAAAVPDAVKTAAQGVIDAQALAVKANDASSLNAFSTGLAIDLSPGTSTKLSNYQNLNLGRVTRWGEWLLQTP